MKQQTEYRKISDLKKLPNNPRIIKDAQFKILCTSIKNNPDYFEARPIILSNRTGELTIIAGNQRYEAAKSLNIKQVPTFLIPNLTEEREREIIIRDNISNGSWDYDILANEWDTVKLEEWGLEIPNWSAGHEANNMNEGDLDMGEEFDPIGNAKDIQRVVFIFKNQNDAEKYCSSINVKIDKIGAGWQVNLISQFI